MLGETIEGLNETIQKLEKRPTQQKYDKLKDERDSFEKQLTTCARQLSKCRESQEEDPSPWLKRVIGGIADWIREVIDSISGKLKN